MQASQLSGMGKEKKWSVLLLLEQYDTQASCTDRLDLD